MSHRHRQPQRTSQSQHSRSQSYLTSNSQPDRQTSGSGSSHRDHQPAENNQHDRQPSSTPSSSGRQHHRHGRHHGRNHHNHSSSTTSHSRGHHRPSQSMEPQKLTPIAFIYLVRHGETHENRAGIIQGQLDTVLNEEGVRQANKLAEAMKDVPLSAAWTSDLKRARDTAEIVMKHHPNAPFTVDKGLRERFMGSLQGSDYRRDKSKPLPEECEPSEVFTNRAIKWWEDTVLHELSAAYDSCVLKYHPEQAPANPTLTTLPNPLTFPLHILAVSHGAYIATLVRALGRYEKVEIPEGFKITGCWNTSVSIIELYAERSEGRLVSWSDIRHLLSKEGGDAEWREQRKKRREEREKTRKRGDDMTTKEEEEERVDIVRVVADDLSSVQVEDRGRQKRELR